MASNSNGSGDGNGSGRLGIPFGERGGRLLAAASVERGLACGCVCPGCGASLVARQGAKRRAHFAHHSGDEGGGCFESAVHRYAKQVVAESCSLRLPGWNGQANMPNPPTASDREGVLRYGEAVDWPAVNTAVGNGHVEVVIGEIRSDAVVTDPSGDLLVEIRVSHLVDEAKATKVRAMNARMIEIDLSTCPVDLMMDAVLFAEWIRFAAPRHWIWEPSAARCWERSRDELEARLSLPVGTAPRTSGMLSPVSPERWEEIRQQFGENEWIPIGRPPVVDDPLIGCWVWLDGKGEAEIVQRLTRAGGVYRVRLSWGEFRIVYLGRPG